MGDAASVEGAGKGGVGWPPPAHPLLPLLSKAEPITRSRSLVRCPENLSPLSLNAELPVCSAMAMKTTPPPSPPQPPKTNYKLLKPNNSSTFLVFVGFFSP